MRARLANELEHPSVVRYITRNRAINYSLLRIPEAPPKIRSGVFVTYGGGNRSRLANGFSRTAGENRRPGTALLTTDGTRK